MPEVNETHRKMGILEEITRMAREIQELREDESQGRRASRAILRDNCRARMLESWERLAAHTGNGDMTFSAIYRREEALRAMPDGWEQGPERRRLRELLSQLLENIREMNVPLPGKTPEPPSYAELLGSQKLPRPGRTLPDAGEGIQEAWGRLTALLGHGRMALEHAREQPVIGFDSMGRDPFRAMGIALVHLETAGERYQLIARHPEVNGRTEIFEQAERESRLARQVLWLIHHDLAENNGVRNRDEGEHRAITEFIRRYARACHEELAEARRAAMLVLGQPQADEPGLEDLDI